MIEIGVALMAFIAATLSYFEPRTKKIRSLLYIRLALTSGGLFFLIDAISIILLDVITARIGALMMIPTAIFFTVGVNHTLKETYNSIVLIICSCFGTIFFLLAFTPDAIIIIPEGNNYTTTWSGAFLWVGDFYQLFPPIVIFYWGYKTLKNAPILIKREAILFFIGICFASPIVFLVYIFSYLYGAVFILITDVLFGVGVMIYCIAIMKEPKLLYILPFTVYRIIVKDRKGYPLFDHDWSHSNIDEEIFTGFINAVQIMSEEVMNIGGLLDINLQKGILILHESESITVGLVSSKTSQLLKDSIVNFTSDFEDMFEKQLKESCIEPEKYEPAYLLIDKHFSNFPFRLIPSKRHPMLLSGDYADIPLELENRLRSIVSDEDELSLIKSEILKAPYGLSDEFLSLYDEIKEELKKIEGEESKYLDSEINEDK
ncbi:MAG: hypothetical protein ACFFA8_08970 [Promethearchaeota archaeon]